MTGGIGGRGDFDGEPLTDDGWRLQRAEYRDN